MQFVAGQFRDRVLTRLWPIAGVEWRSDLAVMAGVSPPRDAAMSVLPSRFATVILHFAPLFYHRSWRHAEVLLIGAILAPGTRTVASRHRQVVISGPTGEATLARSSSCGSNPA